MDETVYVCMGTCGAQVSQAQYDNGLTVCGAEACTLKGQPFKKMFRCADCQELHAEEEVHQHEAKLPQ